MHSIILSLETFQFIPNNAKTKDNDIVSSTKFINPESGTEGVTYL